MSTTAWEVLGIDATEDPRTIKRAYAQRLKSARPDEDAEAFQQLTEAFESALAYARQAMAAPAPVDVEAEPAPAGDAARAALPELGRPMAAGDATDAPATQAPDEADEDGRSFDFGPFFADMTLLLRERDPRGLRDWLERHEDLYSIELKWALIPHVFDAVARAAHEVDPHRGHLEVLQGFFGVDAALRRHPALAPALDFLEAAPWRGDGQQEVERAEAARRDACFESFTARHRSKATPWFERLLFREWMDAPDRMRRLFILLMPLFPTRLFELFGRMQTACGGTAFDRVNAEAMAFWSALADRNRLDRRRVLLMLVRVPLYALPVLALVNLLAGRDRLLAGAESVVPTFWAAALAWMVAALGLRRLRAWNDRTLRIDPALGLAGLLLVASAVLVSFDSGFGYGLLAGAALNWMHPRSYAQTLLSVFCGFLSFGLIAVGLGPWIGAGSTTVLEVGAFIVVGMVVAADVLIARVRRLPLIEARARWESPAWILGGSAMLAAVLKAAGEWFGA